MRAYKYICMSAYLHINILKYMYTYMHVYRTNKSQYFILNSENIE